MKDEIWKQVRFYEKKYEVSDIGNVRSIKNGPLKPTLRNGKHYVSLTGNGFVESFLKHGGFSCRQKVKNFEVGYLVAMAFKIGSHLNERHVYHIDGNLLNNSVDNLAWTDRTGF